MSSVFQRLHSRATNTSSNDVLANTIVEWNYPRKCFIASVPEDALAMIFSHVFTDSIATFGRVITDPPPALSILKLSHVNRQFRLIALSYPHLWTYISGMEQRPTMGLVNACLERSRDLPLTVNLYIYIAGESGHWHFCDNVLLAAKLHAHRWHSVHFTFVHVPDDTPRFPGVIFWFDEMEHIIAPALESLVLYNESKKHGYYIDFLETWSAPALSSLVTLHVFPSPLSPILALTSLELRLSLCITFPTYIFDVFSKMQALTDLSIFFDDHQGLRTPPQRPIVLQRTQLHSVLRLRITCTIIPGVGNYYGTQLESYIFRQLCFPNAHDLNVTFIGEFDNDDSPEPRFDLSEVAGRVFHRDDYDDKGKLKPRQFPRVSSLQINISVANENRVWEKYFPRGVAVLPIPLQVFPSLKELRVHCSTFLDLSTHYLGRPDQPALRRVELNTPKLESSSRDSGPPLVYWRWIRALAIALTAQCVWGEFEQLTLIERVFETYSDGTSFRKRDVKMELSRDMIFVGVDLDNLYIGDESNN